MQRTCACRLLRSANAEGHRLTDTIVHYSLLATSTALARHHTTAVEHLSRERADASSETSEISKRGYPLLIRSMNEVSPKKPPMKTDFTDVIS